MCLLLVSVRDSLTSELSSDLGSGCLFGLDVLWLQQGV